MLREASARIDARAERSVLLAKVPGSSAVRRRIAHVAAVAKERLASYAFACRSSSGGAAALSQAGGSDDAAHLALSSLAQSGSVALKLTPTFRYVTFTANKLGLTVDNVVCGGKDTLAVSLPPPEGSEAAIAGVELGDTVYAVNGIDAFVSVEAMVKALQTETRPLLVAFDQSNRLAKRRPLSSPQEEATREGKTEDGDAEAAAPTPAGMGERAAPDDVVDLPVTSPFEDLTGGDYFHSRIGATTLNGAHVYDELFTADTLGLNLTRVGYNGSELWMVEGTSAVLSSSESSVEAYDLILSVNGTTFADPEQALEAMRRRKRPLALGFVRPGAAFVAEHSAAARPWGDTSRAAVPEALSSPVVSRPVVVPAAKSALAAARRESPLDGVLAQCAAAAAHAASAHCFTVRHNFGNRRLLAKLSPWAPTGQIFVHAMRCAMLGRPHSAGRAQWGKGDAELRVGDELISVGTVDVQGFEMQRVNATIRKQTPGVVSLCFRRIGDGEDEDG